MKRSVLKRYRGGPALKRESFYCPECENTYALPALPGELLAARKCPYGHTGLQRGWLVRILEALR